MERSYLIRYGLMGQIGRFAADPGISFRRGESVVIRSHRGTELGEVLIEERDPTTIPNPDAALPGAAIPALETARILRPAAADDLERAQAASHERDHRFRVCQRLFQGGVWPVELIDVEPLLDEQRTVLHYLGPHRLDVAGVLAAFRAETALDVMLQPVGRDIPEETTVEESDGCGTCGTGGCGSGGGCGASSAGGGCGDCGVQKLLASRR